MKRVFSILLVLSLALASAASAQTVAGRVVNARLLRLWNSANTADCKFSSGAGSPDTVVSGKLCDTYWQTDAASASDVIWVKTTGTAGSPTTTGWTTATSGAPASPSYLTLATNATLTSERVLTAGTGISFTDGGAGSTLTVATAQDIATTASPSFAKLGVGNGTIAYTVPTRVFSVADNLTGTLGATSYAAAQILLTMAPGAAPSGQARALDMTVGMSGTQNHTGEITAGLFNTSNSTSGAVAEENGGLFAVQRSVGASNASQGIRVDRNYSGGATINLSPGVHINSPNVTGGASVAFPRGLLIDNQTVSGATNSLQIESQHSNSGYWHLFSDGSFEAAAVKPAVGNWANGYDRAYRWTVSFTGGAGSAGAYHYGNDFDYNVAPSANSDGIYVGVVAGGETTGTHSVAGFMGLYGAANSLNSSSVGAWDSVTGGGSNAVLADAANYSTGTVADLAGFTSWGGTGAGSTTGNLFQFRAANLYEYSGTGTTLVGFQVDDMTASGPTGFTNNWAFRYSAPSSKTFGVKSNGDLTLGGASMTFPGSNASGCLSNNGSGTLSWAACSSTGSGYATVQDEGVGLTARATVNFIGAGVTCVDNGGSTRTDCTISSGGGSGSITASGYTQNTGKLLGRTTASSGAIEEITPGSNLTFTGGALDAKTIYALQFNAGQSGGHSPADATTYRFGLNVGFNPSTNDLGFEPVVPFTGSITRAYCQFSTLVNGSAQNVTVAIHDITAATSENITTTLQLTATNNFFNNTGLTLAVTAGDRLQLRMTGPTWTTNPTGVLYNCTLILSN